MRKRDLVIGIVGVKGSGKDTLASMLVEEIPDLQRFAWALSLKLELIQMVFWMTGETISLEDIEVDKSEIYGPMLQGWGAYRRKFCGEDYWIKEWDGAAPQRVVIPDVRHFNEARAILEMGGHMIGISSPSHYESDGRSIDHESERHVPEIVLELSTVVIANDGSLDHLRDQAKIIAGMIASVSPARA